MGIDHREERNNISTYMPDLGKTHMSIALKYFFKKLTPRDREYKVLKKKVPKKRKY